MQRYPQDSQQLQQQQHNPRERKYIHNPDTQFSQRDVPYSSSQYNPPSHQPSPHQPPSNQPYPHQPSSNQPPQTNYNSRQQTMFQQPDHGNMANYPGQMGRGDYRQSDFSSQQNNVGQYDGDPFDDTSGWFTSYPMALSSREIMTSTVACPVRYTD